MNKSGFLTPWSSSLELVLQVSIYSKKKKKKKRVPILVQRVAPPYPLKMMIFVLTNSRHIITIGEGVKHKSYLDPILKYVFAYMIIGKSQIFDPRAHLTPCTGGVKVCCYLLSLRTVNLCIIKEVL